MPNILDGQFHAWDGTARDWFPSSAISGGGSIVYDERYATLAAAIAAIGSAVKTLIISTANWPDGNVNNTVPSTLTLAFMGAGSLSVSSGKTTTILSAINLWPARRVFTGTGIASLVGNLTGRECLAEWWGSAVGGSSATNLTAFKSAGDSGLPVRAAAGIYDMDNSSSACIFDNGSANSVAIRGAGVKMTMFRFSSLANPGFIVNFPAAGEPSFEFRDLYVRGAALKSISAGTNANPVHLTITGHGFTSGQTGAVYGATGGWAGINGRWTLTVIDANTVSIPVNSTGFGSFSGQAPSFLAYIAGNHGIWIPGYHASTAHYVSDGRFKNVQGDYFGDGIICIRGDTGPIRVENPILNSSGGYAFQVIPDDATPGTTQSQDITVDGGSIQGEADGGVSIIGAVGAPIGSFTMRDTDIELRGSQSKPCIFIQRVVGAKFDGVTVSSQVDSLSVGSGNIELDAGAYGNDFDALTVACHGNLNAIHAVSGSSPNRFVGGNFVCDSGKTGFVYAEDAETQNKFTATRQSNWATGHNVANVGDSVLATIRRNAPITLTNNTPANITSIILDQGEWDISAVVSLKSGITTATAWDIALNTTSATLPAINSTYGDSAIEDKLTDTNSTEVSLTIPTFRLYLSSRTTVYLVAQVSFTGGTAAGYGRISARCV